MKIGLAAVLLLTLGVPVLPAQQVAPEPLRVGSFPATMPYGSTKEGILVKGFVKDLAEKIAAELGLEADFNLTPKKRTEFALEQRWVNILPIANPAWVENPDEFEWSVPLFIESDVFVTQAKAPLIVRTEDLRGRLVGTMRGYTYPGIDGLIKDGLFRVSEGNSLAANLKKLESGFVDAVYDSDILIRYKLAQQPGKFALQPLVTGSHAVQWAIYKNSTLPKAKILALLKKWAADGTILRLLETYWQPLKS